MATKWTPPLFQLRNMHVHHLHISHTKACYSLLTKEMSGQYLSSTYNADGVETNVLIKNNRTKKQVRKQTNTQIVKCLLY